MADFSLTHFLDRFAFKNPKKESEDKPESIVHSFHHKHYTPHGSRGKPIKQLRAANCTEDEKFIFEYLDRKRERQAALGVNGRSDAVDDDEFDAYLDGLGGKKKDEGLEDDEFDVAGNYGEGKSNAGEEDDEDWDSDGDEDDDDNDDDRVDDGLVFILNGIKNIHILNFY